jgi:N-acetylglucosamine-6-phosphate deacetylase
VIFPSRRQIETVDLLIDPLHGRIERIGSFKLPPSTEVIEASGLYVAPGFIDLQVNGGHGVDFASATEGDVQNLTAFFASHGTTGLLATLITAPIDELHRAMRTIQRACASTPGILGVHLEGPFISPRRPGTHPVRYIQPPSLAVLASLAEGFQGLIQLVTLAPELPGAEPLIREINRFAVPALGHTDATYEQAQRALEQGARLITHLFNAMRGFHHREPGIVGAALTSPVMVSLIADGLHVHPATLQLAVRAKGPEQICLVSDAISATGMGDGLWKLGHVEVVVKDGVARNREGVLAGSLLTLDRAVKNFLQFTGLDLAAAIRTVTWNPAKLLGLEHRKGELQEGMDADLVIFDEHVNVRYTLQGGRIVYARS